MINLFFDRALLPDGWARDVTIAIDPEGVISRLETGTAAGAPADRIGGIAVPGLPNLHSHAHQRAMAGLAERSGPGRDSFWTWRQTMYRFVSRIDPEGLEAVAAALYADMLEAGYTAVAEFHYLHHGPDGTPYADPGEMARRCLAAARTAGIGMTLLPVLYRYGGFGGEAPGEGQRRFVCDADGFAAILASAATAAGADPDAAVGIAPHSLRAVDADLLTAGLAILADVRPGGPVHIHVAEQRREVDACVAWSGRRPVEWLLGTAPVDGRWCLIHATHMSEAETLGLARSGAVAGLCPTTEANLGDGLFPAGAYAAAGGRWGVGSDSHVSVDPREELRWLEYGRRLADGARTVLAGGPDRSTGRALWEAACAGGARACGRPLGALAPGHRADIVVLDPATPILAGRAGDAVLDTFVFVGGPSPVRHVFVGGRPVVENGRHRRRGAIDAACRTAVERLAA